MSEMRSLPYSWGDVADTLSVLSKKQSAPSGLVKADIYWDQATFYLDNMASVGEVEEWLEQIFPFRIRNRSITLDGPSFSRDLQYVFEKFDDEYAGPPPPAIPSQYVAASSQIWFQHSQIVGESSGSSVPTFAFHSVKGGVGRTTSALSFASILVDNFSQRPLLVDADFEAPGISYLFHGDGREAHISLEDVLVLAHAETDPYAETTVQFVAEKLSNQTVGNITILPCLRSLDMLSAFAVRPEQLQRSHSDQPFILLNLLRRIASAVHCTSLIIDLRAGFTDLAAMILCAPKVSPIFVTTPSGQAIASTRQMLSFIGSEVADHGDYDRTPAIIVNNVIAQVRRSSEFERIVQDLEDSSVHFVRSTEDSGAAEQIIDLSERDVLGVPIVALDHSPALTAAPSTLKSFLDDLRIQPCYDQLSVGLREWSNQALENLAPSEAVHTNDASGFGEAPAPMELRGRRQQLHDFAQQRIFAESGDTSVDQFLEVRALQQLANRFKTELPNATCIGMKGAGKTFTFRVLCQHTKWATFTHSITGGSVALANSADTLPVLPARSLQLFSSISAMRSRLAAELGGGEPISFSQLNSLIERAAQESSTEGAWAEFWLDAIGWSCGFQPGQSGAGKVLIRSLIEKKRRLVSVFDGLEESFQAFRSDIRQQTAIRGLTSSLPQMLSELPGRPVGQINFVRSDLIGAAFPNNARQFADRNRAFALTWYERDILELAAWLAQRAGVADTWDPKIQEERGALEKRLYQLWGRKLGKADDLAKEGRTREPRSAEWVIAALSDLKGRLTARDLVGFLSNSAERSLSDQNMLYRDRLLTPRAMTGAITPVGREKIAAMVEESPGLGAVVDLLRQAPQFSVPIGLADFLEKVPNLTDEGLKMLQENGIILVAGDAVEMPEIFRTALSNVVRAKGGRRSIIGLMNRARQYRSLDAEL